jgi:hypothetical protein
VPISSPREALKDAFLFFSEAKIEISEEKRRKKFKNKNMKWGIRIN